MIGELNAAANPALIWIYLLARLEGRTKRLGNESLIDLSKLKFKNQNHSGEIP